MADPITQFSGDMQPSFAKIANALPDNVGKSGASAATEPEVGFGVMLQNLAEKYPALSPHVSNFQVQWGDPKQYQTSGRHLEFYPPWESENPNPGKATLELYNTGMKGGALESAVLGDMLHYLGATNPETGKQIDPTWRRLRDKLMTIRGAKNLEMDRREYEEAKKEGESRSFEDWMNESRADAYVRGYLTPDEADEWRKNSVYTPEMEKTLETMKSYLSSGK
jgi:hypothetical protein